MPNPFENVKSIKSTIIGIVLIGFAIYMLLHQQEFNLYFAGGLIIAGILLVLSPDTLIDIVKKKSDVDVKKKL
jgi:NhaP-type Na+/H+ or K+/H+ antiporter